MQGAAPLPASPRWGEEPGARPQRGRVGERGCHHARGDAMRAGRPRSQIMFIAREPRFPHAPARGKVRAQPACREMGKPGFPILPPGGRVWEGATRAQGDGETGVPHPPTRWEGVGGRSPRAGRWGNRGSPSSHPVGGCGRAQPVRRGMGNPGFPTSPSPGGYGRPQPFQEQPLILFHPVVRGAAAWMAEKNLCKGLTKSVHRGMLHRETFLGAKYRER